MTSKAPSPVRWGVIAKVLIHEDQQLGGGLPTVVDSRRGCIRRLS